MKRTLYLCLLFSMLFLIAFPLPISAGDPTYTPYDYLESNEKDYVNSLRSWITVTKGRIDTAKTSLGTFFLQDYNTWYPAFLGELTSVNNGIAEIKKISAPDSFQSVNSQCQSLNIISPKSGAAQMLDPSRAPSDIAMAGAAVGVLEGHLDKLKGRLDKIWTAIDNRINAIAKEEQMVADALSRFLQSCEKNST